MSNKNKQREQSQSKLQMFFMVIVIPVIFAIILAVVLLFYLGFNVGDTFRQATSFLPFAGQEEGQENQLSDSELIAQLEHENSSYIQQLERLENELEAKDNEIESLEDELLALQNDELSEDEAEGEAEDVTADADDIVKTLEDMTASRAADIIAEFSEEEAATYLRMMRGDSRSDILSRVEPELAAELLSLMSN